MWRRSETGGWRSQTQFESRWVIRFQERGIAHFRPEPQGNRGAVGSETGGWQSQTQFDQHPDTGAPPAEFGVDLEADHPPALIRQDVQSRLDLFRLGPGGLQGDLHLTITEVGHGNLLSPESVQGVTTL